MLNISCICRLVESGNPVSHSQSTPNDAYKGAKKPVMIRHDCSFISLFSSLIINLYFFLPGDAAIPFPYFRSFLLFCFVLSCEHVQPEAVLPAQGQRCVQVPSLRRTSNNIPPSSSSPSSPRRRQELFCFPNK